MSRFLICRNPGCRFLVDLRDSGSALSPSRVVIHECPDCGHPWQTSCPFCLQPLDVTWHRDLPHCARCHRRLRAEVPRADAPKHMAKKKE